MAMRKEKIIAQAAKRGLTLEIVPLFGKQGKGLVIGSLPPIYMPGGVANVLNPKYLEGLLDQAELKLKRKELDQI